jgi:hypothetical protein
VAPHRLARRVSLRHTPYPAGGGTVVFHAGRPRRLGTRPHLSSGRGALIRRPEILQVDSLGRDQRPVIIDITLGQVQSCALTSFPPRSDGSRQVWLVSELAASFAAM